MIGINATSSKELQPVRHRSQRVLAGGDLAGCGLVSELVEGPVRKQSGKSRLDTVTDELLGGALVQMQLAHLEFQLEAALAITLGAPDGDRVFP